MRTPAQPRTGTRCWTKCAIALLAGVIVLLSPVQASAVPASRAAALEAWLKMNDTALMASGWTGSVEGCVVGTESQESIAATLNAVNTLRDFAGVGPVTFDPTLNRKALAAALMIRASNQLNHYPAPSAPCYSDDGAAGSGGSNLFWGYSGVRAMTGYMIDDGTPSLGHRRHLINPLTGTMGTGSTGPGGNTATGAANALYVYGAGAVAPTIPEVISWPGRGHVPWQLMWGTWSAALNVAGTVDASAAQVAVTIDGRTVPVSGTTAKEPGYGTGPVIAWDVAFTAADRDLDATINVTINGVKVSGVVRPFSYVINTIRAAMPKTTTSTGSRTESTVTIRWNAAVEQGVPVTGYRIVATDGAPLFDRTVGPAERELTVAYTAPSKTVTANVVPLSRLGSPPPANYVLLRPPGATAPPATPPPAAPPAVQPSTGLGTWTAPALAPVTAGPAPALMGTSRARFVGSVTLRLARPGRLRVGSRLIVKADVRGDLRLSYQWRRGGRAMSGATRSTYRLRRRR